MASMKPDATRAGTQTPEELNSEEAKHILEDLSFQSDLRSRLDEISARFLGLPYAEGLLGGGLEVPEVFRVSLEAFDCVTYMETVLALASSAELSEFVDKIRRIRYERGKIDWFNRNHYMVDWAKNNEQSGFIANMTFGPETLEKSCTLALIAGRPERTTTFRYFPTLSLPKLGELIETGDLIFFVSTMRALDVFHTGLLVKRGSQILMRHATRSAGSVVEQALTEFVSDNEMAGFILLRPLWRR